MPASITKGFKVESFRCAWRQLATGWLSMVCGGVFPVFSVATSKNEKTIHDC